MEENGMEQRKKLIKAYKEQKAEAGVYLIRNKESQKIFVSSTPNLKSLNGRRFELNMGSAMNKELQKDWNTLGEASFEFEILEVLDESEKVIIDKKRALKKLEDLWLEKLQPYDDRGYNRVKNR